jgi:hypothetical protein
MGFAAPVLAVAGIAGAGLNALGAYNSNEAASQSAAYQAQVARNNAVIAGENVGWTAASGAAKEAALGMKTAAAVGKMKATQGASGVDVNTGSSANVRASAAEFGALDQMTSRSNTAREAYGYEVQATGDVAQAQLLETESTNYANAAPISALGTFLSGASSVGGKWSSWGASSPSGPGP